MQSAGLFPTFELLSLYSRLQSTNKFHPILVSWLWPLSILCFLLDLLFQEVLSSLHFFYQVVITYLSSSSQIWFHFSCLFLEQCIHLICCVTLYHLFLPKFVLRSLISYNNACCSRLSDVLEKKLVRYWLNDSSCRKFEVRLYLILSFEFVLRIFL